MCEELKDMKYMSAYVEEAGETSLCSIVTKKGCDEKSLKYIAKMEGRSPGDRTKQLDRLTKMLAEKMSKSSYEWVDTRVRILKQFAKENKQEEL